MAMKLSKNGKRLGRPPKDKSKLVEAPIVVQTKPVEAAVAIAAPAVQVSDMDVNLVPCELVGIPLNSYDPTPELKFGKYIHKIYNIEWFGTKKWVIASYVKADFQKYRDAKCDMTSVLKGCVNHLNTIKNKKSNKYGSLELYSKTINFKKQGESEVAVVELIIDERKNPNFWGEGQKIQNGN